MYSEFACLVDYLIQNYGKEKFLVYMNRVVNARTHNDVFFEMYQVNFEDCLQDFKNSVMQYAEE